MSHQSRNRLGLKLTFMAEDLDGDPARVIDMGACASNHLPILPS